ncbi:MAG: SDR family oxidoreductase, partial [Actinocatenispora sp.]
GQAVAVGLASAGADLVLHGHHDNLDETERRVREVGRRSTRWIRDLSDPVGLADDVGRLLADTRVDILVNNAGIIRRAPAAEMPAGDWDEVIATNLNAPFVLARAVGAGMVARQAGKIITVASLLSFQGGINVVGYTASKHAVVGMTRALSNEWAGSGVQVNAIAPGYIATDNTTALRADPVREPQIRDRIPAGRWGTPDDLVGAAVFLASPAADYVCGHVLTVDGGWLAR